MAGAINWRGAWGAGLTYQVNDLVTFGGSSYISNSINTSQVPSSSSAFWSAFVIAGAPGAPGSMGPAGPPGTTVPVPGPQGIPGPAGVQGDTGPAGVQGPAGPTGLTGPTGPTGPQGVPGAVGATGQGLTWRNVYSSTEVYNAYDCVSYSGAAYICIANNVQNINPVTGLGTSWNVLSAQGIQGIQGPQGIQGDTGVLPIALVYAAALVMG